MTWPVRDPTRFHDGCFRLVPIWTIAYGSHVKYAVSRAEMLTHAQARWAKLYAYVLRAPGEVTPANITGDVYYDKPEQGIPVYRNSTWDVLATKPLDGNQTPIFRSIAGADEHLRKAGVQPIYLPRPTVPGSRGLRLVHGEPEMFVGYGWIVDKSTRHNVVQTVVAGANTNTIGVGHGSGGHITDWIFNDGGAINRDVLNLHDSGFGEAMQVALHFQDKTTPRTGQQNPTMAGNRWGNPTPATNAMAEPHPGHPLTLESLIGQGSVMVSHSISDHAQGGKVFRTVTCPLDFQSDRYGSEVNINTPKSAVGETFPDRPIIWPSILFHTELWVAYKGDPQVHRMRSSIESAIDLTDTVDFYNPQFDPLFFSMRADRTEWFNNCYSYDPATTVEIPIHAIPDLWGQDGSGPLPWFRNFIIARDGVYRLDTDPDVLIAACPFLFSPGALIFESAVDSLCIAFFAHVADNQDPNRMHEMVVVRDVRDGVLHPAKDGGDRVTYLGYWRYVRRSDDVKAQPRQIPPGNYGPFESFIIMGGRAAVKTKIDALYAEGKPMPATGNTPENSP